LASRVRNKGTYERARTRANRPSSGHRRNLEATTIASFVVLGATGSLGYALSLFFVTILYTPTTVHKDDTPLHDALFTPSPVVYYLPITLSLLFMYYLPTGFAKHDFLARTLSESTISALRWGKVVVPLLLAFAPDVSQLQCIHRAHLTNNRSCQLVLVANMPRSRPHIDPTQKSSNSSRLFRSSSTGLCG
jgi:hypothetical protein